MKKTNVLVAALLMGMFFCAGSAFAELRPVKMERAGVLDSGRVAMNVGLALEKGREADGLEYDNIRLHPFGARVGLGNGLEVGAFLGVSINSDDDPGAPDESGLEGLTVFGKLALNENVAVMAGLTVGGDDDIAPYPNDGLDFFVNVPMQKHLNYGMIYGQFGYRVQGGDFDSNAFFNYGVGYAFPLNNQIGFNAELVGEEARVTGGNRSVGNTLDLVLGANMAFGGNFFLNPYLSVGIYDSSPDVALGALMEVRF